MIYSSSYNTFNSGDFNFYRYVGNSPGNFRDPFGNNWETVLTIGGGIAGGYLAGGATFGLGTVFGMSGGAALGNAIGSYIDDVIPLINKKDNLSQKEWQDFINRTRKVGKDSTKGICKLGAVGKL